MRRTVRSDRAATLREEITIWIQMQIRRHCVVASICCGLGLAVAGAIQEHLPEHSWDYGEAQGPNHWGELKPEFATCKNGHSQSPIDIRSPQKSDLPSITFDYKPSTLRIVDNGHTIMINYDPGSFISIGGKKYVLKQFHFHRPSEEKIDGKRHEMVVHLVHADEAGKLVVIAVLLEKGHDNALIRELWNHLPKTKEKEEIVNGIQVNASSLLPAHRDYYTFSGSLTTPPCSEDVRWFVFKDAGAISAAEVDAFSRLYPHNVRPTQPLYGRVVLESR
jgi:carbonic anhydrase